MADPISDLLDDATRTEVIQQMRGRAVVWGLQVLDPTAVLEVPEILDVIITASRKLLSTANVAAHPNPLMAKAMASARDRDTKGRKEKPDPIDAADVMRRLQRIAIRSVISITVEDQTQRCRLVASRDQQTPAAEVAEVLAAGGERLIWVGMLDRGTLQNVYYSAAVRIEEAASRLVRFPGRADPGRDAGSNGASLQHQAEHPDQPASG
jgi:hypothetical protein